MDSNQDWLQISTNSAKKCRKKLHSVALSGNISINVISLCLFLLFYWLKARFSIFLSIVEDDINCVLCDSPGDLLDQLFCTSCGLHYHGICLDMAVTPLRRAGWQCPDCKVCQTCKWVPLPPTLRPPIFNLIFLYSPSFSPQLQGNIHVAVLFTSVFCKELSGWFYP